MTLWNLQQNVFMKSVQPTQQAPVWEHLMPGSLSAASKLCRYVWSSTKNAFAIAKWLQKQLRVQYVLYPGLENHPGYVINKAQTTGFGGMISFAVDNAETARQILEGVKLIKFAESLGGTESLITYPIRQTHTDLTAEECAEKGITDCLLRFSTGIEATQDIIDDLAQAFAAAE